MAVAVDNTGQSAAGVSTTTVTISSFVQGAGSNRVIYLGVSQWKASDTQPTATFNGSENFVVHDSQTIAEAPGVRRVTIFKLVNPTVTTANIVVTWASAVDEAVAGATSWTGVDQTTPFGTGVKNSGTAASSSINLTGAAGDVTHDTISADGSSAVGATPNQTQRWRAIAAANTTEGAGQSAAGTGGAVAHTWSTLVGGGSAVFAHIGVAIQQASGGASGPLVGVGGTRRAPGQRGPFDARGFLKARAWDYTIPAATANISLAIDASTEDSADTTLSERLSGAIGLSSETSSAGTLAERLSLALGASAEDSSAATLIERLTAAIGSSSEESSAGTLAERLSLGVGSSTQDSTAGTLVERIAATLASTTEDSAGATLAERLSAAVTAATEDATAATLFLPGGAISMAVTSSTESRSTATVAERLTTGVTSAGETRSAASVTERLALAVTAATATYAAALLAVRLAASVTSSTETRSGAVLASGPTTERAAFAGQVSLTARFTGQPTVVARLEGAPTAHPAQGGTGRVTRALTGQATTTVRFRGVVTIAPA